MNFDINTLLRAAVEARASDLHLQVGESPDIRVDGKLQKLEGGYPELSKDAADGLLMPILTSEQKKYFESAWELDFSYSLSGVGRFRVNYHYQQGSIGAAFRYIPDNILSLAEIQAPLTLLDFARLERGLVLLTGPTGSGKSTTLAAMLDVVNSERACTIVTLEDPIEFVHTRKKALIKQREIGRDTRSFSEGLRRVLRQDPDVILVGEMRDQETTAIALTAAETGHLVLSTIHTRSAPSSIDRIIDQFPPDQQEQIRIQTAASLAGVVTQTLLPRSDGVGRVAAHEVLIVTGGVAHKIREGKTHLLRNDLQTQGEIGMQTMDQALVWLVQQGWVDVEIAKRQSQNVNDFESLIEAYKQGDPVQSPVFVTPQDLKRVAAGSTRLRPALGIQSPLRPIVDDEELCPIHHLPLKDLFLFDDETGESLPKGTTHRYCLDIEEGEGERVLPPTLRPPPSAPAFKPLEDN